MSNFIKKTNELITEIHEIITEKFEFLEPPFYVYWVEANFSLGPYDHNFLKFDDKNSLKYETKSPEGETLREGYVYPKHWGDATILYLPSFALEKRNKLGLHLFNSVEGKMILKIDEDLESSYSGELQILSQKFYQISQYYSEILYRELLKTDFNQIETIAETAIRHDLIWLGQADGVVKDFSSFGAIKYYTVIDLARLYRKEGIQDKAAFHYQMYIYQVEKSGVPDFTDNEYLDALIELAEIKGAPDYEIDFLRAAIKCLYGQRDRIDYQMHKESELQKKTDIEVFMAHREGKIRNEIKGLIENREAFISPRTPFTNELAIINLLGKCNEYVYWVDLYFSVKGLDFLSKVDDVLISIGDNIKFKEIKIIRVVDKKKKIEESFRGLFKKFKKEMSYKNISSELRVITDPKIIAEMHDRFIITKDEAYNVPSTDVIARGQLSEISKSENKPKLINFFKYYWEESDDLIDGWDKIKEKMGC